MKRTLVALVLVGAALAGCGSDDPAAWSEDRFLEYTDGRLSSMMALSTSDADLIDAAQGLCDNEFEEYGPQDWYDRRRRAIANMGLSQKDEDEIRRDDRTMIYAAAHTYCPEFAEEVQGL